MTTTAATSSYMHEDHLPYTNPGSSTHKDISKQHIHGMLSKCQQIHGLDPGHGRGVEGDDLLGLPGVKFHPTYRG